MQGLARPSANGVGGPYSPTQVLAALTAPVRAESWRFDRLSNGGTWLSDLTPFIDRGSQSSSPQVEHDTTRDVKRLLSFTLRGDAKIDLLSDLVRPHYLVPMSDGGLLDFSLGTFTLLPYEDDISPGVTWRQIQGADPGQLLVDGAFLASYSVPAGTGYIAAIQSVIATLNSKTPLQVSIIDSGKVLPSALGWVAGDTRLKAVNDLLSAINYFPAWWDDLTLRSSPIPDWNTVTETATFDCTQSGSIVRIPLKRSPDLSQVYNQCLVKVEDPNRTAFSGFYSNDDPTSATGTVKWHPKLTTISDSSIADAATADALAKSTVQQSQRLYVPYQLDTFAWPVSQDNDVYRMIFQTADEGLVNQLYVETYWLHRCGPGQPTTHDMTQIVRS